MSGQSRAILQMFPALPAEWLRYFYRSYVSSRKDGAAVQMVQPAPEVHQKLWGDKPYNSIDFHMKQRFGGKVMRLSLSSGCSCPNRDGKVSTGGCIFCSEGGSGDFAESAQLDVHEQIEAAKKRVSRKLSSNFAGYIAYFQSFTNTYGPVERLEPLFTTAAMREDILAVSIATRPDCLPDDILQMLVRLNKIKPVMIELGLQTIHESTAAYINRGYALDVFDDAVKRLKRAGLEVIVHVIIGLPGENAAMTEATVSYLSHMDIDGIKLQLLHVLKGTELCRLYEAQAQRDGCLCKKASGKDAPFESEDQYEIPDHSAASEQTRSIQPGSIFIPYYSLEEYAEIIVRLVSILPERIVIHRITGDAPKKLLVSPMWSADKKRVLNTISAAFRKSGHYQGDAFHEQ